ncbi:MAG: hypothetical protein LBN01_01270 [Endomicrobium sp.]|nr:hypothetical protein [Endomicrobium sp.]
MFIIHILIFEEEIEESISGIDSRQRDSGMTLCGFSTEALGKEALFCSDLDSSFYGRNIFEEESISGMDSRQRDSGMTLYGFSIGAFGNDPSLCNIDSR